MDRGSEIEMLKNRINELKATKLDLLTKKSHINMRLKGVEKQLVPAEKRLKDLTFESVNPLPDYNDDKVKKVTVFGE